MPSAGDEVLALLESALTGASQSLISDAAKQLLKKSYSWFKKWWDRATDDQRRRISRRIEDAIRHYQDVDLTPAPVPLRILKPWVERASVEDRELLQEAWSNLLANAMDPRDSRKRGHSSFMEIMRQLDTPDTMVLLSVCSLQNRAETGEGHRFFGNDELRDAFDEIGFARGVTTEEVTFAKQNLTRLGLCEMQPVIPTASDKGTQMPSVEPREISITEFGQTFYEAVRPPNLESDS